MRRAYLTVIGVLAACIVLPATAQAANVAVLGNNQTDEVLVAAGHTVTLVTDAEVATPGFLNGFDVFIFTRPGGAFNATLSTGAAAQVRAFTRRAVLLNGDFADDVGSDQEIRDLYVSSVLWAAEDGGGYIGELEGATAGLSANGDGQPAINLIAGTAGASQFTGNDVDDQRHRRRSRTSRAPERLAPAHRRRHRVRRPRHRRAPSRRCSPATPATTTPRSSRRT